MMKLYIFRHGQTQANILNLCHGVTDEFGLTDKGRKQAESLARKLKKEKLPVIFSSPLKRTKETARIVAAQNGARIEILPGLHELDGGSIEGLHEREAIRRHKKVFDIIYNPKHPKFMTIRFPGGENMKEVIVRFHEEIEYIRRHSREEKVGVATHGSVMRIMHNYYLKKDRKFNNCEFFVLEL